MGHLGDNWPCYSPNSLMNSLGEITFCPLHDLLGKCFLLPVMSASARVAKAASNKGASLLSGKLNDSAKAGAFIPLVRMNSSTMLTLSKFKSILALPKLRNTLQEYTH